MNKKLIIFGLFAIVLAIAGFIIAETSDLEIELNNLVSDLEGNNYGWLVDYNVDYPSVEVYEENFSLKIADFGIIDENKKYQIYLDGSSGAGLGNKTQNIFDLKILGGSVEFDYIVDPIILGNANSVNTNTTYENNFTHLNVSNSSIVAYYPFDENYNSTFTFDYTNNSNDGTLTGGTIINTTGCVYGNCYTFDGVNDVININPVLTNNLATTTKGTWSAWVKVVDATAGTQMFMGFGDTDGFGGLGVYVRSSRVVEFFGFKTTSDWVKATTNPVINSGQWHHVAVTYAPLDAIIYIDGVAVAQSYRISTNKDVWFANVSGLDNGRIGANNRNNAGDASFFNGSIDEVMIWNTELNSTEVLAIYNNQTVRFHGTGEMNYTGVNFAGNNTINITLAGCQQNMGTSLRAKVNNGAYVNFSSGCTIQDYNATGNLNSANVTIGFVSDTNKFYTPLVIGNISLDSTLDYSPNISINLPTNNSFSSSASQDVNFTVQDSNLNTCWYSNDSYTVNTTLTNCNTNITTVTWSEGQHNVTIWVNDTANHINSSGVTFTIDTILPTFAWENPTPADKSSTSSNSTYLNATVTDATQTSAWFDWNKSLVGYWPMDFRNSTDVFDNSTYNNFGTISGAVFNSSGFYGGAYTFDGADDCININPVLTNNLATTTKGTWSVWVKPNTIGQDEVINFGDTDAVTQITIELYTDNKIYSSALIAGSVKWRVVTTNAVLSTGVWKHLALVQNGTSPILYVNGVAVAQTVDVTTDKTTWFNNIPALNNGRIGCRNINSVGNALFVDGDIDEVLIFDRALSATEISALYNNTANRLQNNFTSLSDATYNYSAYSIDKAGNLNITSPDRQITIDTTFPTISYDPQTPADNSTINVNSIYVNVSVVDTNFENMSYSLYNESLNISGLVGYWNFDRNTTTIRDLSKQGNDGTRSGGVNWTTGGKLGNGYSFDGVNDYISIPHSADLSFDYNSSFSISLWFKKTALGTNKFIYAKRGSAATYGIAFLLDTNGEDTLDFDIFQDGTHRLRVFALNSGVSAGVWYNAIITYNGTNDVSGIKIYLNGTSKTLTTSANSPLTTSILNTDVTTIGTTAAATSFFDGNIDEPMIFNRALSSTEVSELYNRSLVNYTTYSAITPSINWTSLADNDYHYFADVLDKAENYNFTQIRLLKLDTTFPTWSANETNLTPSTLNGKGVYFNITLTETNPSTYIFSWYNGTAWENTTSSYTNAQEVSISKTINIDIATINWTWYINDSANNLNQTDIWSVTLLADDNVAPNVSFANPTTNATNLSQNFIFANLSFADATSSISMANISLFNSTQNIINSTQGTTSTLEINFTGLVDGTYYLNASVNDTLGNRNQTETRKIILDATAPNLTINSPTSGTYETSTILFNATSIDATTLVDSCWYTINSGTTNRTLSKDGATNYYNFTASGISDSTYTARFYCNDSANNVNNTQTIAFTINTFVPAGGGPAPVSAGGAGGGGASKPEKKRIFNLGYNMYDQTISLNQVEFDKLRITNNGETADEYNIEVKTIDNIISFEERKIKLEPGESKDIEFKISSPKEPGIYTGKIIVSNGISEREVLATINVKTEKSLFDITLTIPESLKTLLIGQNLISKIDLIQMGLKENIDVTLNYAIKDFEGQTYLSESETIAVLDQKSYEKEFFTGELPPGQYVLGTELIHPDGVAVASTHFVVQERGVKFGKSEILLTSLILVLVLISLVLFLSIRKYKRIGKTLKTGRK